MPPSSEGVGDGVGVDEAAGEGVGVPRFAPCCTATAEQPASAKAASAR
jgi:hypothetical protein